MLHCRWLKAAALAEGKDRLDFLTMHVVEVRICGGNSGTFVVTLARMA